MTELERSEKKKSLVLDIFKCVLPNFQVTVLLIICCKKQKEKNLL